MKTCNRCRKERPLDFFYKGQSACKECYTIQVRAYRANNIDKIRAYDRSISMSPNKIASRLKYAKTEVGRANSQIARDKWIASNAVKRGASVIVTNAVREGKLIKKYACESCSSTETLTHGHHDDYAYPLTVRWLCAKCHVAWHRENGHGLNG